MSCKGNYVLYKFYFKFLYKKSINMNCIYKYIVSSVVDLDIIIFIVRLFVLKIVGL